jgi:alpha-tubulin suppressor-like RCC1 family protein
MQDILKFIQIWMAAKPGGLKSLVRVNTMDRLKEICWIMMLPFAMLFNACLPLYSNFTPADTRNEHWKTYTNSQYGIAIEYPAAWKFMVVPNEDYPAEQDQVWFSASEFPFPQSGARADIVLIMTPEDPSSDWQAQYFDDYKSEKIQIGNLPAMKISGINREGKFKEVAIIIDAGSTYILALGNQGSTSLDIFDRVVGSIRKITPIADTPAALALINAKGNEITAGAGHTCMVTAKGTLECWGHNGFGQLGNGESPATGLENGPNVEGVVLSDWVKSEVSELQGAILSVTAGAYHTCVLTRAGGVKCWGQNAYGQLGDGTTIDRISPVDVQGLTSNVVAVSAGAGHTCALMDDGSVKCWGQNNGLLGNGTTADSAVPVDVIGLPDNIIQVQAGWVFTCALASTGEMSCWGDGTNGRFGDGSAMIYREPVKVEGLAGQVTEMAAGQYHLCALLHTGEVICWGALSSDREYTSQEPLIVTGLDSEIVQLVAGGGHTCALTAQSGVKCWGDNYFGQLGDGTNLSNFSPVDINGLTKGVVEIASGAGHVCALLEDGGVKCWGDGSSGQLGDDSLRWK